MNNVCSKKNFASKYKGFTLIELLVVVAIIGVLASVIVASLSNARIKTRDAARMSNVRQIRSALEFYYNDYGRYPNAWDSVTPALTSFLVPQYMPSVPDDPYSPGSTGYASVSPNSYVMYVYYEGKASCKVGVEPALSTFYPGVPVCN